MKPNGTDRCPYTRSKNGKLEIEILVNVDYILFVRGKVCANVDILKCRK